MSVLDPSSIVPIRMVERPRPATVARLRAAGLDLALSLMLNLLVVGSLIHVAFQPPAMPTIPEAISVDLVPEPAEPKGAPAPAPAAAAPAKTDAGGPPANEAADPLAAAIPLPPASLTPLPKPSATEVAPTPPMGTTPPPVPAPPPPPVPDSSPPPLAPAPPPPPAVVQAAPATEAPPVDKPSQPATPAPLEQKDDVASPRLIEAPSDPKAAAAQADKAVTANDAPKTDDAEPAPDRPEAPVPSVLTSPDGDDGVPKPAREPDATAETVPPTAEDRREAENTAKLAAALPFAQSVVGQPFRAAATGAGTATSTLYRGEVYGAFRKAEDVVEAARAKHLHGQAVIAFTIDDAGGLARAAVAVSSGNPEVDQAALDYVRRAAPYPPPPPGATRNFSPAIGFGLDEP